MRKHLFLENKMLPFHSKHFFPLESLYRSNIFFFTIEPILAKAVTAVFDLFWPVMKSQHFETIPPMALTRESSLGGDAENILKDGKVKICFC